MQEVDMGFLFICGGAVRLLSHTYRGYDYDKWINEKYIFPSIIYTLPISTAPQTTLS